MKMFKASAYGALLALFAVPVSADREFESPASGTITGKRYYCGSGKPHTGGPSVDIRGKCGRCIYAARGGRSYYSGGCGKSCDSYGGGRTCNGGAGNYVRIYHDAGYKTRYLHGLAYTKRTGAVTDSVRVLKMGATGLARHVHLHYDMWRYGTRITRWVDTAPSCYSTVKAGYHIRYNFPGLSEGDNRHGLHGC